MGREGNCKVREKNSDVTSKSRGGRVTLLKARPTFKRDHCWRRFINPFSQVEKRCIHSSWSTKPTPPIIRDQKQNSQFNNRNEELRQNTKLPTNAKSKLSKLTKKPHPILHSVGSEGVEVV